jgi:hypothetical protein
VSPRLGRRGFADALQEELLILKMVIKCSDIGNVTKGKEYCMQWTERVIEEFFAQVRASKQRSPHTTASPAQ